MNASGCRSRGLSGYVAMKQSQIPVISYDRLLLNSEPDYYVEFDSPSVGKIQGQALVDKLKEDGKKGSIIMINGAPTDNNAKLFKQGAHSVIDDSGFPKDGADSPGVARMYCGTLGKVGNCQIGVSVHAVTDWASAAIDWQLFLPTSWDESTGSAFSPIAKVPVSSTCGFRFVPDASITS